MLESILEATFYIVKFTDITDAIFSIMVECHNMRFLLATLTHVDAEKVIVRHKNSRTIIEAYSDELLASHRATVID